MIDLLRKVGETVQAGQPKKTLKVVSRSKLKSPWATNAIGVYLLPMVLGGPVTRRPLLLSKPLAAPVRSMIPAAVIHRNALFCKRLRSLLNQIRLT
jgi:hypothetical protein